MDRKHNQQSLAEVLKAFYQQRRIKPKLDQVKVRKLWASMMGPSIQKYTEEVKLVNNKLMIKLTSAPLRQELSYGKEKIQQMMNAQFEEEVVKEVVIY